MADDIFLFPYDDASAPSGSTIDGFFANIDRTRRDGLEIGSALAVGPLSFQASYAWTLATFQVDDVEIFSIRQEVAAPGSEVNVVENGDRLPLVPDHSASLGVSLRSVRGWTFGLDARYTGERFLRGDEANEESPLDGYWVSDVRAGYERAGWEVQAIVRNWLDARYATFGTFNLNQGAGDALERFLTPAMPRSVQLVLRRQIGRGDET